MPQKTADNPENEQPMQASTFDSEAFLRVVTEQAGVYRMYDSKQVVIYVGKAKQLKKRLASYFRKDVGSVKTQALVKQIAPLKLP